jgi:hypothetical protein
VLVGGAPLNEEFGAPSAPTPTAATPPSPPRPRSVFAALHEEEPGTFYLTEFLARHFEQLVVVGLGLDRHPQLRDTYFGSYRRVVLLAPRQDDELVDLGRAAADRLGLAFEVRLVGPEPFLQALSTALAAPTARTVVTAHAPHAPHATEG